MQRTRELIAENIEKISVLLILVGIGLIHFFVLDKLPFLSFYYLPVLLAAWGCGRRTALLVSVLAVFLVVLYAVAMPSSFSAAVAEKTEELNQTKRAGGSEAEIAALQEEISHEKRDVHFSLATWGSFLILAAVLVGTLYEQKEKQATELKQAYIGILEMLTKCLECTDEYVLGHSERVAQLGVQIARELGLSDSATEKVRVGGLLHDIGKVEVSVKALQKSAALSEEEREEIAMHPLRGAEILQSAEVVLRDVIPIVRLHHERVLDDEVETPDRPGVRLDREQRLSIGTIAVADAYDAIVSDRPYRPGKLPWQAVQEIEDNAGKQFDSEVVAAFKKVILRET
jgi:putative nucleotidyltransferase with HDIG domain